MPALSDHAAASYIHALCIGSNGTGKTGALASLAKAGYKLRIVDYDQGVEVLANVLRGDPAIDNILVESFSDPYWSQPGTGALRPKDAVALAASLKVMASWPGETEPNPAKWGTDHILVIDTLTAQGRACMNHVAKMKGKLASLKEQDLHPSQPDWGDAMGLQENFLAMLASLQCHVIVNSHVNFIQPEGQAQTEGFPSALGAKLPPKVGGYFNHILYFAPEGMGAGKKRRIFTKTSGTVTTKTAAPGRVKDSYSIETGLAEYFADVLGPRK